MQALSRLLSGQRASSSAQETITYDISDGVTVTIGTSVRRANVVPLGQERHVFDGANRSVLVHPAPAHIEKIKMGSGGGGGGVLTSDMPGTGTSFNNNNNHICDSFLSFFSHTRIT